jgi:hypothetical protein
MNPRSVPPATEPAPQCRARSKARVTRPCGLSCSLPAPRRSPPRAGCPASVTLQVSLRLLSVAGVARLRPRRRGRTRCADLWHEAAPVLARFVLTLEPTEVRDEAGPALATERGQKSSGCARALSLCDPEGKQMMLVLGPWCWRLATLRLGTATQGEDRTEPHRGTNVNRTVFGLMRTGGIA